MEMLENNSIVKRNDKRLINETRGTGALLEITNVCFLCVLFSLLSLVRLFPGETVLTNRR